MPPRKTTNQAPKPAPVSETPELDTLLSAGTPDAPKVDDQPKEDPNKPEAPQEPEQTPEQAKLAALRAELAAEEARARTNPTTDNGRPVPESQLTPEQREIRILEDRLAAKKAENIMRSEASYDDAKLDEAVRVIHFIQDGLTANNRVWYTGQTAAFGARAYEDTKDRNGNSWVDYTEAEQYRAWGKIYFREGPWQGATYEDAVSAEDRQRGTKVPVINL